MNLPVIDPCTICSKPKIGHERFRHAFVGYDDAAGGLFEKTEVKPPPSDQASKVRIPSSGDPILRMVLLRKGLITVADLDEVEAELRATGVAGYEPPATLG